MNVETLTRQFLAEAGKTIDLSRNPCLTWENIHRNEVRLALPVVSVVSPDFLFRVSLSPRMPDRPSLGIYHEGRRRVFALDINGRHRQDGVMLEGSHLHRPWTEAHHDSLADPIDAPADLWPAINFFLALAKITEVPEDWWSYPEVALVVQPTFWNLEGGA